jgi:PAS domain S-box-containing protein
MKNDSPLNRKMQLAFGSAVLTLLVVGVISYRATALSSESDRWVRHTHEVLENLEGLLASTQALELSSRGFLLTGEESYLASFRACILSLERERTVVAGLTLDNPDQQRRILLLGELAAQKIQLDETNINLRRTTGLEAATYGIQNGEGQRIIEDYREVINEMEREEQRLLVLRDADAKRRVGQAEKLLITGSLLGMLIAAVAGWSAQRDCSQRLLAEESLRRCEENNRALQLTQAEERRLLVEGALLEWQEKYRMLLDGIRDYAIFMMDPRGQIVSWNAGAERIKGYRADEIIGQNFSRFFPPEDIERGRPEEILRMTAASGRHEEQGMRVRKDGSRFLASLTFTALRDAAGDLRGFSEFSHDLSESKESGAKYRGLLEAAPDAMVVVNQAGEIVLLNLQAEKQFGYHRDELVGQRVKNIIPEGFAERLIADDLRSAEDALAQQIGTGIELTGRRKDGSEFPIEIMLSPLESAEGILVTAAIRDISVRKEAEKHLAQMEGRYRGLLEAAPDAMVVVNQAGEIVLLNVQAEKQFGYRRDELVGQRVKNIIPEGFAERLIADGTRTAAEALAQQIGTGIELNGRRKDGSEFPIEIMLSPLESADGILVTAAIRDISVRKAAEKHVMQMEGRYRGLLEAAPDAMVVVNQGGEIVLLNVQAEKQFGYHRDELVGQKVKNIIPEGFAERLRTDNLRSVDEALAQQIGTGIELIARRKDGSDFPIEIMLSPLESAEGILVTAAIRDITVRKKSEEHLVKTVGELKRSNDELQQFAYVASHDLQEPLRMVASYTQLLAERYKGRLDSDADEFIAYAVDGSNRMQGLIQDLLAYSRAGTNGKALRKISTESPLQEALANLRATIQETGAVVTHGSLPVITTDGTQLAQIFQNLVGNAIKYHGAATPRVHVSAVKNGGNEWIFSVRDNGLGIDPQYFERIFVLFQRLHGQTEFKGTGIGLAICKKMLERLGGRIWVESQPEQGSTFYFALPERNGK